MQAYDICLEHGEPEKFKVMKAKEVHGGPQEEAHKELIVPEKKH